MLTMAMRDAFGYDDMGNSEALVAEADKKVLHNIPRAGGDVICEVCKIKYVLHPPVQGALWATRTCQGIVKL